MKTTIARVCLVLSVLLFIFGTMMLCDCSGEFLLAGLFALVAVIVGMKKVRIAGVAMLVVSLVVAVWMW